jgi:hypothetical protein
LTSGCVDKIVGEEQQENILYFSADQTTHIIKKYGIIKTERNTVQKLISRKGTTEWIA